VGFAVQAEEKGRSSIVAAMESGANTAVVFFQFAIFSHHL